MNPFKLMKEAKNLANDPQAILSMVEEIAEQQLQKERTERGKPLFWKINANTVLPSITGKNHKLGLAISAYEYENHEIPIYATRLQDWVTSLIDSNPRIRSLAGVFTDIDERIASVIASLEPIIADNTILIQFTKAGQLAFSLTDEHSNIIAQNIRLNVLIELCQNRQNLNK